MQILFMHASISRWGHKGICAGNEMECYISLEEKMACGIGACLACVCKSKDVDSHSHVHNKRICKDGPE